MEQRERSRQLGRDLLGRELRKQSFSLATAEREGWLESAAERLRLGNADDLLVAVGYGKVNLAHAADAVLIDQSRTEAPSAPIPEAPPAARRPAKRSIAGVRVQGEADILVKFAKCCTPVPGDDIVGFISRGHGVVIHKRDCPKALELDPARRLDVSWDEEAKTLRPVAVQVTCTDRPGLLAAISKAFTEQGVNISQAKCRTTEDGRAVNTFQVTVGHLEQLKTVLRSLGSIEGVVSATRL
jgi:GTP pyrophosphokinase